MTDKPALTDDDVLGGLEPNQVRVRFPPSPTGLLTVGNMVFPIMVIGLALSKSYHLTMGFLVVSGFAFMTQNATANTLVQTTVPDNLRGRVMSVYTMVFQGFAIGSLIVGAIAEFVGVGAVRYNIARVQAEKRIVFRWEEALNFEGNSAPFLQYAHARACSILDRAGPRTTGDARLLVHPQEQLLLRRIARFPSVVRDAAESRRVHAVAGYAAHLAAQFNQLSRDCPVLNAGSEGLRAARLELVDASRVVLHNALDGLGLVAPREM